MGWGPPPPRRKRRNFKQERRSGFSLLRLTLTRSSSADGTHRRERVRLHVRLDSGVRAAALRDATRAQRRRLHDTEAAHAAERWEHVLAPLRCLGRRRWGVPERQADGDRDRAALRPHQGEESTIDAERVGHVNARARDGAFRLLHHSIQRWTAPAPQASNPAWPVHRWKTFAAGLHEHPERMYATAAGALLRRRPPRRRAPQRCNSSSANDPQRPRTRRASSSFLFSKRLDLGQQTLLKRARRRKGQRQQQRRRQQQRQQQQQG